MKKNKHYQRTLKKINPNFKARTMLVDYETNPNIIYYSQEPVKRLKGPKLNIQQIPYKPLHIKAHWVERHYNF